VLCSRSSLLIACCTCPYCGKGRRWKVALVARVEGSAGSGSEPRFEQSRGAQAIISTTASGLSLATAAALGELSLGGAGVHIRPRFLGNGAQRERILHHLALDGGYLVCACADLLISLSSSGHPPTTTTTTSNNNIQQQQPTTDRKGYLKAHRVHFVLAAGQRFKPSVHSQTEAHPIAR
jgi:hypothetical protein